MKAVVLHENGDLNCLKIEDVADPEPRSNEVVIRMHSAALNHLDIWVRRGMRGQKLAMPHILGSDGSGVIVSKGANTHGVNIGDAVILNPGLSCSCCEYCRRGQQSECPSFGIIGMSRPGTFAEKIAVPFGNVWPKPAHLDFQEAAALPLVFHTAWRMLMARAGLMPGETVLIHGIGGGVALACLQLAKLAGATAFVTSSSDEKLGKAAKLGADYTINYRTANVSKSVMELTGGRGVDVIADTVGAATLPVNLEVARRGGRIVLCGVTSGSACQANLQAIYWNQLTVLGSTLGSDEDLRQMLMAVSAAKLRPVIDSVEPLENIKEATARMEQGRQFGKIVLSIHNHV
jgi:NADPH:quinone reductase-like Zn-dependent oxidoreductase